jgi:hypothetical protein
MHFSFHLDANLTPDEARRISAAVLALGGVTDNAKQIGELTVAVKVDTKDATEALDKLAARPAAPRVGDGAVTVESIGLVDPAVLRDPNTVVAPPVPPIPQPPADTLDVHGLPWDDRIHSSSRARNADGSWRAKRGVAEHLVKEVEAELRGILTPTQATEALAMPPAPPVPPIPAAIPPVPTAKGYPDVVNLIMRNNWPTETWFPVIGESLPNFAKTCQTNPGAAQTAFDALSKLAP